MNTGLVIFIGFALTALCFFCSKLFLDAGKRDDDERAFWYKGTAGLCFVALGFLFFSRCENSDFAGKVFLGLCCGLIGDQFLALRFIYDRQYTLMFAIGTAAFAVGHILYISALLGLAEGSVLKACIIAAVYFAAAAILLVRHKFRPGGALNVLGYVYIAIVTFMGACALAALAHTGSFSLVFFALAGILFIVSDVILCIQNFGDRQRESDDLIVHTTYYAAQCLIAWTLFFI